LHRDVQVPRSTWMCESGRPLRSDVRERLWPRTFQSAWRNAEFASKLATRVDCSELGPGARRDAKAGRLIRLIGHGPEDVADLVEPGDGVLQLQKALLMRQRDGQHLREAVAEPGRVVEAFRQIRV